MTTSDILVSRNELNYNLNYCIYIFAGVHIPKFRKLLSLYNVRSCFSSWSIYSRFRKVLLCSRNNYSQFVYVFYQTLRQSSAKYVSTIFIFPSLKLSLFWLKLGIYWEFRVGMKNCFDFNLYAVRDRVFIQIT